MISVTGVIVSTHSHPSKEKGVVRYFDLLSMPSDGSESRAILLSVKDARPESRQNDNFFQGQNVSIEAQFTVFNGKLYWAASSILLDSSSKFSLQQPVPVTSDSDTKTDKIQRVKAGVF